MGTLSDIVLSRVSEGTAAALLAADDLELLLNEKLSRAQQAWPQVKIEPQLFIAFMADRLADDATLADVSGLLETDLYLACGCCIDNAQAIAEFDRNCVQVLDAPLAQLGIDQSLKDELKQRIRTKLLTHEQGDVSKISAFQGRGSLAGWVRVTALRMSFRILKQQKRNISLEDFHLQEEVEHPELDFLKSQYRAEFSRAFEQGFAQLTVKDRNLLRMTIIDKLDTDAIGRMYDVHRTTAARWVAAARTELAKATRKALRNQLQLSEVELQSILRLVRSRIDTSVNRILANGE